MELKQKHSEPLLNHSLNHSVTNWITLNYSELNHSVTLNDNTVWFETWIIAK